MKDCDAERIRGLRLFSNMGAENFTQLITSAFLQKFPAGTTLMQEGDRVDFLYILTEGMVELEGAWNDKESIMAVLSPLSVFVLSSVILETHALLTAKTVERSEILMLSAPAVRLALHQDHGFALAMVEEVAGWQRSLVRTVKNHKLRNGTERLANFLLTESIHLGGLAAYTLPLEKRQLASLLGMTPESLSRAFATLAEYGVEVNGARVNISNLTALKQLAKPSPYIDNHLPPLDHLSGKAEREIWPPREKDGDVSLS